MATRLSNAYLLTKVLTANNREVVVYLYEGAIGYLHKATAALREGRRASASTSIEKAVSILVELSEGLNYTISGHLALQLDSIYNYLIECLTLANGRADADALESCEGILVILHDAWRQVAENDAARADDSVQRLTISA